MRLNVEIADRIEVRHEDMVFYVKPLTIDEFMQIQAELFRSLPKGKKKAKDVDDLPEEMRPVFAFRVLARAIVGWKGLQDRNGKDIPCNAETIPQVLTVLMKEGDLVPRLVETAMSLINTLEEEGKKID